LPVRRRRIDARLLRCPRARRRAPQQRRFPSRIDNIGPLIGHTGFRTAATVTISADSLNNPPGRTRLRMFGQCLVVPVASYLAIRSPHRISDPASCALVMDGRVAPGSLATELPDATGHISVMIPYPTYRRILAYLAAVQSALRHDEVISSILEGWARRLNL
jgi:hypothetical protein